MKICFYSMHPYYGGLNPNGGSRTLVLSADALRKLGHDVTIVTHTDKYKWHKHPAIKQKIPENTDVVIAASISDVAMLMKKWDGKKAYWMRAIEDWQISEKGITDILERFNGKIMCNGGHMVDWLAKKNISSCLCFSGVDEWQNLRLRESSSKTVIGCLYNIRSNRAKTKRWNDFVKLAGLLGFEKYRYAAFGTEKHCDKFVYSYKRQPDKKDLCKLYSKCHIWFAPSINEGFHNVPAEANLCGCLVVCNNRRHNGMGDYATPETAMVYDSLGEAVEQIRRPQYEKVEKMQTVLKEKIGDREHNMKKLVEALK